ncbi:acyl carrier protein [Xylanibacillus composti]|uniref:Carrier domain-containing protein n=1 Tax=Xylanibacillus composti TaxID=1572762 RepID=A0A8J4H1R3_9BACL|nr:phosphopantetheine-binding protein [Xylanibacillus composti]GIQ69343.1 hypothetical protein XYCOK13_21670 [Xylanibacillus composti]
MDRTAIERTIKQLLEGHQIQLDLASGEEPLAACGLSSLSWLRLMIDMENAFQIELVLSEAWEENVPTLKELVHYVESELGKR